MKAFVRWRGPRTAVVSFLCALSMPAWASMITAVKEVYPTTRNLFHVGDTIVYRMVVSNPSSNQRVNTLTLVEDTLPDGTRVKLNSEDIVQLPGNSRTLWGNYVVQSADLRELNGRRVVVNQLRVTGTDDAGDGVAAFVEKRSVIISPAIHLEKEAEPAVLQDGQTVTYSYQVSNLGDVPLKNIVLIDDRLGTIPGPLEPGSDANGNGWLDLGEVWQYRYVTKLVLSDPLVGESVTNVAEVCGQDELMDAHSTVCDDDDAVVVVEPCPPDPKMELIKTAHTNVVMFGQSVEYCYEIRNTGNVPLTNVVIRDNHGTPAYPDDDFVVPGTPIDVLGVGATQKFCEAVVPAQDLFATIGTNVFRTGTLIVETLPGGDIKVTYLQAFGVNDNTYGTGAIGWPNGHTFGNLTGSDKMEFRFRDMQGNVVLDFYLDSISAATNVFIPGSGLNIPYPSGYGTLGPFGGDGSMITGNKSNILWFSTGITKTLNEPANVPNKAALIVNSPTYLGTNGTNQVVLVDPTKAPGGWDYINSFSVIVKGSAFGTSGFCRVTIPDQHNSPSKVGVNSFPPEDREIVVTNLAWAATDNTTCEGGPVTAEAFATVKVVWLAAQPPEADVGVYPMLFSGSTLNVTITNRGSLPLTLSSLRLRWPATNGSLRTVKFMSTTVYNTQISGTNATITALLGEAMKRTLNAEKSAILSLQFTKNASPNPSGYLLELFFNCETLVTYVPTAPPPSPISLLRAGEPDAPDPASPAEDGEPAEGPAPGLQAVVTSDEGTVPGAGFAALDGSRKTAWHGSAGAGGWYIALAYDPAVTVRGIEVDLAPDSLTNIQYRCSTDARNWDDLLRELRKGPVLLNYLWLIFPADGTDAVPRVREIRLQ